MDKHAKTIDKAFKTGNREYYFTPFAYAFVRACRPPAPRAPDPKVQT
jgi:hypothetical protein